MVVLFLSIISSSCHCELVKWKAFRSSTKQFVGNLYLLKSKINIKGGDPFILGVILIVLNGLHIVFGS